MTHSVASMPFLHRCSTIPCAEAISTSTTETFYGAAGNDFIDGRGGFDIATYNNIYFSTGPVTIDLAAGTATGDASIGNDTLRSIEGVQGTNFNDVFVATGYGNGQPATLNVGNNGTFNQFEGLGGNDTITGNGNTKVIYSSATDGVTITIAAGGAGSAHGTIAGDLATVGTDTFVSGVNAAIGSNFGDVYDASEFNAGFNSFQGNGGNDTITGNGATQILYGSATAGVTVDLAAGTVSGDASVGTDTFTGVNSVAGSNFNDTILGGATNDFLAGNSGNDILNGRGGDDNLTGGTGADTFLYADGGGADVVTDFNRTEGDKIDLTGVSGIHSFAELQAVTSQSGNDTIINFGNGNSLTLANVSSAGLVVSDFLFSDFTTQWTNPNSGNWNTASNWSTGVVPGIADNVFFGKPVNVTFNTGSTTVNDINTVAGATLTVSGGSLVVASTSSIGGLVSLSAGTFTLNGQVDLGSLVASGGLLTGTGTLTVSGLSTLSGGRESGAGTTIASGGAAFTSTGFSLDGGRALQLGGASTAAGTFVQIQLNGGNDPGSGILTIGSGATFNDQTTSSGLNIVTQNFGGTDTGATAVVNNLGTFTKSGNALTSTISTIFNNSGTVNVQSGTLSLSGGGTDVGASYSGTGTIQFSGGIRTLDAASSITAVNATFSGGTTTLNGVYNVAATTTVNGGTVTLAGTLSSLGNALTISGGNLSFNTTNATVATLTISSGTLSFNTWNATVATLNSIFWPSDRRWHADGIGAIDVVRWPGERGRDDDRAGRGGVHVDGLLAGWRAGLAAGWGQHGGWDVCPDSIERWQRSGFRDLDDRKRGDVQRPDHEQRFEHRDPEFWWHRHRRHRGREQSRYLHQERQCSDLDDLDHLQQQRHRQCAERDAKPVRWGNGRRCEL